MPTERLIRSQYQNRECQTKRDTDSLGGVKIQFAGKANVYGYPLLQLLETIPQDLQVVFSTANETVENKSAATDLLWKEFWNDVTTFEAVTTTTDFLWQIGCFASVMMAFVSFFLLENTLLTIGCVIVMMVSFRHVMNNSSDFDKEGAYVSQINQLLDKKYNHVHFRPRKWMAKCHIEKGVSYDNIPGTYYIVQFYPIRKTAIQWDR